MARADWLEAGFTVLAGGGPQALTIERLCALTGRTKGSFYHHFKAMAGFEAALLGHWKEASAERVAVGGDGPADLALGLEQGLETAMRRWAAQREPARRTVAEVDALRLTALAEMWNGDGDRARLEYAAFVGLLELTPDAAGLRRFLALLRPALARF